MFKVNKNCRSGHILPRSPKQSYFAIFSGRFSCLAVSITFVEEGRSTRLQRWQHFGTGAMRVHLSVPLLLVLF